MCALQLPVLYWIINILIQRFTLQRSTMPVLFKNYSLVEVIPLLMRFNRTKSFLWNKENTDRNGINGQKTHTPRTQRKITLERVKFSVCDTHFLKLRNISVCEITSDIKLINALDTKTSLELLFENIQSVEFVFQFSSKMLRRTGIIFPTKEVDVTGNLLLAKLYQYLGKCDKQ